MKLRVIKLLDDPNRVSSVDIFRAIAIISVVIFHFESFLPLGFIGVDLFFVISGLLIGNLLTQQFIAGQKINFFKFFLQRGLKIWPSYYFFFFVGSILALLLYRDTNPDQIIPLSEMKSYLLFYRNYSAVPFHFSFDHVWSLCVEEHFYILLPLLFVFIQTLFTNRGKKMLILSVGAAIFLGIAFKYISLYYTNGKDTYSATHNRIDALAWGVLLNFLLSFRGEWLQKQKSLYLISVVGGVLFFFIIYLKVVWPNVLFNKIWFHSILPFTFALLILGVYYVNFSRLKTLRVIAYFSYNWYLWHPIFAIFFSRLIGNNVIGLILYVLFTFVVAVVATVLIEEPMLRYRSKLLKKLFRAKET
jgi:peptidoglycan/LPS O-acetylase OafA/YrhL